MENKKPNYRVFLLSFIGLSFILAMGPYLTLQSAPALGSLLSILP